MSNPLLPNTQITMQDLLLIIGDQTVTIAALRQQLNTIKANTEKAYAAATPGCSNTPKAVEDAKGKEDNVAGLRRKLEAVETERV